MFFGAPEERTEFEIVETPESATAPAEKDREIKKKNAMPISCESTFSGEYRVVCRFCFSKHTHPGFYNSNAQRNA